MATVAPGDDADSRKTITDGTKFEGTSNFRSNSSTNWRARVFEPAVTACQKAEESFPSITPHDLRHTAASLAISAGANVKAVQRMLGHAKASMTLDVYADLFDTDLDDVATNLDMAIRSAAYPLRTGNDTVKA
jgi:integrase